MYVNIDMDYLNRDVSIDDTIEVSVNRIPKKSLVIANNFISH